MGYFHSLLEVEKERKEGAMWYGTYYGYPFYPTVYPTWGYGAYGPFVPYWYRVGYFPWVP